MHSFSEDCVLMVLACEYYDEADYIRSYDDFFEGGSIMRKILVAAAEEGHAKSILKPTKSLAQMEVKDFEFE